MFSLQACVCVCARARALWLWVFSTGRVVSYWQRQFMIFLWECFSPLLLCDSGRGRVAVRSSGMDHEGGKVTVFTFLLLASRALCLCSSSLTVVFTRTPWYTLGLSAAGREQHVTHVYQTTSMEQTIAHTEWSPRHTAPPNPRLLLLLLLLVFHSTMHSAFLPQIQKKKNHENCSQKLQSLHEMIKWSCWMYIVVIEMSVTHIYRVLIKSQLCFKLCVVL